MLSIDLDIGDVVLEHSWDVYLCQHVSLLFVVYVSAISGAGWIVGCGGLGESV